MNQKKKSKTLKAIGRQGFTLTEMLIVIALIAMVGTFVTTNLISKFNRQKVSATKIQMRQMSTVLKQFRLDCGRYPTTDEYLDALLEKPPSLDCPNFDPEGYIEGSKVPKDGFDREFEYESDGNTFRLGSLGNDKKPGGEGIDADIWSDKDLE